MCRVCEIEFWCRTPPKRDRLPTATDHAAFVERVREIAEGMVCAPDCDSRRPGHMVGGISFDVNSPPRAHEVKRKCNCPRGKLLALCEVR